ncbi:hypothetical protein TSOC_000508 [Tetrabaena socialis]|uniref:Uncharacterized protein n=1 Tax=Tetrabaena socialis TaxID=47790 RepID=A0A2J8AJ54_9CHLO|nr:hypothetical protein TSOC_000508 [Tetrabaena socialis]|eukprot:PNH12541.1 hypothetical protein TSOC_000508 [Tetrabaena socialis]
MMAKLQMPFERFRAVDGSEMTDRNRLCGGGCRILGCSPGMIGCYLSHVSLLSLLAQTYAKAPTRWFLVFEDDASVRMDIFQETLHRILLDLSPTNPVWSDHPYPDTVQLGRRMRWSPPVTPNLLRGLCMNGTTCYLVSSLGAKKMVAVLGPKVYYHIDAAATALLIWPRLFPTASPRLAHYMSSVEDLIQHSGADSTVSPGTFPKLIVSVLQLLQPDGTMSSVFGSCAMYGVGGWVSLNATFPFLVVLIVWGILAREYWFAALLVIAEALLWSAPFL